MVCWSNAENLLPVRCIIKVGAGKNFDLQQVGGTLPPQHQFLRVPHLGVIVAAQHHCLCLNDITSGTVLLQQANVIPADGEEHSEHLQIGLHLLREAAQLHQIPVQLLFGTEPVVVRLEAHRRVLAGQDEAAARLP